MYLISVFLPGLSSLSLGLFGRKIGQQGAQIICTLLMFTSMFICVAIAYEVLLTSSSCYVYLSS